MRRVLIAIVLAGCGAPGAMAPPARFDLSRRVLANPRDVPAHLALATLDEKQGRPSEALAELETVVNLGGPLGIRWHDDDKARMARLLLARSAERRERGAASALPDLERARSLGAAVGIHAVAGSKLAAATSELHHVDAEVRAHGRALLAELAAMPEAETAWRGARPDATAEERGQLGAWLWSIGARREAYEQLVAWHRTPSPDPVLARAFSLAQAWWSSEPGPPATSEPAPPFAPQIEPVALADAPFAAAAVYAHARFPGATSEGALLAVARAYHQDPGVADRLGRDLVAADVDAAAGHATLGALFDALGDPPRARAAWQVAVEASPEPWFLRGLAEAAARTGDGSAAMVFATQAAAAWGDPAVVWISVGNVLEHTGLHVDALAAARSALDLAGPDQLTRALDLAIAASRSLGRTAQADAMVLQRVQAGSRPAPDATDPDAALLAYRLLPTAGTIARMWVASRAHPDALELRIALLAALSDDDPRRATVIAELVALAGDPDPERGLAAAFAVSTRGR